MAEKKQESEKVSNARRVRAGRLAADIMEWVKLSETHQYPRSLIGTVEKALILEYKLGRSAERRKADPSPVAPEEER